MRIAIIGAGVNGLSCGVRLREAGHDAVILAERRTPDTTSDRSGAVFTPFRIEGHPDAARWTQVSYGVLCDLAKRADGSAGVSLAPFREFFFTPQPDRPWWADLVGGFHRPDAPPAPYVDCVGATVPRLSMLRYMPWLTGRFEHELAGRIEPVRIKRFGDLFERGFDLVVNCAGLGARTLASDDAVAPMRGQVLHVRDDWGLNECLVEEGRDETVTYIFPFGDYVVLGGTYERGRWEAETSEPALRAIANRCTAMQRAAGRSDVDFTRAHRLRVWAGLRPARMIGGCDEAVRLEAERVAGGQWIIHNYGHGRAGVTLSWGCAAHVVEMVEGRVKR